MIDVIRRVTGFFSRGLWDVDLSGVSSIRAALIRVLRLIYIAYREVTEGNLTLRAMSLVYTTLLSIVPLLAISFSVLKAFGVHTQVVAPFLLNFLEPLGERGEDITLRIIEFIDNVKVGVLGSLGIGMLVYTVVSVIQKVEKSFNFIWRIKKSRSLARRFSDYISVMLIGPVLIFSAMGLTASFMSHAFVQKILAIEPFGSVFFMIVEKLPYVFVCAAFTFLYMFIPNTRVQFSSALWGGILAGILWETAGWAFASFTVSSGKYAAIYSGFAILIMFLIWLYLSWLILLVGAQVAFYHQYPYFLSAKKEVFRLSNRLRERLALLIMYFIGSNFYHDRTPWTLDRLVEKLRLPVDPIDDVVTLLERNGLIIETADSPPAYVPARALETITLSDMLDAVRIAEDNTVSLETRVLALPAVDDVLTAMEKSMKESFGDMTIKDLVSTQ